MKYFTAIIILIISLTSCSIQRNYKSETAKIVTNYADQGLFNGSILIARNDSIIFQASYGYADIKTQDTISASTAFPIASLTKQFTATAIMILYENGKLSLEDSIGKYIKVPPYMESVKICNLMNHTSGIPDYWSNNIDNDEDSIYHFLNKQDSLLFQANTSSSYSNSGYFLLGKIIEKISNTSYAAFLDENIFKPLGMKNTFVYDGKDHNLARGYKVNWEINEYFAKTSDGGLVSNIDDLSLWNISLTNNAIIKAETKRLMFAPAELENGNIINNGFGWQIGIDAISLFEHLSGKYNGIVSHTGGLSSFGSYNQYDSNTGLCIILLSNQIRPELMDLINELNKELY